MAYYSTEVAAKKLGISVASLNRYIEAQKVPAPNATKIGKWNVRAWTDEDIERVRVLLPTIANGRKTRYSKLKEKQKAQPKAAVPHKTRKRKKKK
jgi:predicted DNA-binding transcriptional regulator AlpA